MNDQAADFRRYPGMDTPLSIMLPKFLQSLRHNNQTKNLVTYPSSLVGGRHLAYTCREGRYTTLSMLEPEMDV